MHKLKLRFQVKSCSDRVVNNEYCIMLESL